MIAALLLQATLSLQLQPEAIRREISTRSVNVARADFDFGPVFDSTAQRAIPTPPADCAQAVAEVKESRRLIRNTATTGALVTFGAMLDIGSTAWLDYRYACRNTAPGQQCIVEWNSAAPTSLGLVAIKTAFVILATGISYFADRAGHLGWARTARWLGVAAGAIPAAINVVNGLKVEQSRRASP